MEQENSRHFEVFCFYYKAKEGVGYKFGNIFINIDVNRSESGFLPENLTGQMVMQVRGQIAVAEECDEEEIFVVSMYNLDFSPGLGEKDDTGEAGADASAAIDGPDV